MLIRNRIRPLGGVQHLGSPWEGATNGAEFVDFGGGVLMARKSS